MKQNAIALILCSAMLIGLPACSSGSGATDQTAELEQRIQELEQENADLKEQLEKATATENTANNQTQATASPAPSSTAQTGAQTIELGAVNTIPNMCEFTVDYADLKKEVLPPNPDSYYSYYEERDGMTYLDVAISTKNLRTTARTADDFGSVKAICGKGYEYDGFSIVEEKGGGDFTYSNITGVNPLETIVIHYLISIPNELTDDTTVPITLEITMLEQDYTLAVR